MADAPAEPGLIQPMCDQTRVWWEDGMVQAGAQSGLQPLVIC